VEKTAGDRLPVVDHELNFMFTGCYTSQTRIKQANRIGEARLYDAEAFSTLSAFFAEGSYPGKSFEEAWRMLLFNHFHDILTGSGTIETSEFALGRFQQIQAAANTGYVKALRNIASRIDTASLPGADEDCSNTISEGAGVGFMVTDFGVPQTERGRGKNRIFHLFNPTASDRQEPVEMTLWDWPGDINRLEITDSEGNPAGHQIVSGKAMQLHPEGAYWGHKYVTLLVDVKVPAFGYSTYLLKERPLTGGIRLNDWERVEKPDDPFTLENEYVKVVLDNKTASVISFMDKKSGDEYVDPLRPAGIFRLIEEDTLKGMTSWKVGRYMNIDDLNQNVKVKSTALGKGLLRQQVSYSIAFRESKLDVTVSLDKNSPRLDFKVVCDWQERPRPNVYIPQLNFHMPFAYKCSAYKYDIPFGTIVREPMNMDLPGNSWAMALPDSGSGKAIRIISRSKYGFRGIDDSLSLALIRSSYDPDPYPENGIHKIRFAVELADAATDNASLVNSAMEYNHPVAFVSGNRHEGGLPMCGSFMSLAGGSVVISAVKAAEDDSRRMIVRLYETSGSDTTAELSFFANVSDARFVDLNENDLGAEGIQLTGNTVKAAIPANTVASISVKF